MLQKLDERIEAECAERRREQQEINSKLDVLLEKLGSNKKMDDQAQETSQSIHSSSPTSIQRNVTASGGQRADGLAGQPNPPLAQDFKYAQSGWGDVELDSLQVHGAASTRQFHSTGSQPRARIDSPTLDKVEWVRGSVSRDGIAQGGDKKHVELSVGGMVSNANIALHSQISSTRFGSA